MAAKLCRYFHVMSHPVQLAHQPEQETQEPEDQMTVCLLEQAPYLNPSCSGQQLCSCRIDPQSSAHRSGVDISIGQAPKHRIRPGRLPVRAPRPSQHTGSLPKNSSRTMLRAFRRCENTRPGPQPSRRLPYLQRTPRGSTHRTCLRRKRTTNAFERHTTNHSCFFHVTRAKMATDLCMYACMHVINIAANTYKLRGAIGTLSLFLTVNKLTLSFWASRLR